MNSCFERRKHDCKSQYSDLFENVKKRIGSKANDTVVMSEKGVD